MRACSVMRGDSDIIMFSDPDVSGYSIPLAERPAGGEMLRLLRRGDVVIVSKMDRIFRNAADALTTSEKMKRSGVGLILCDMGFEPVTTSIAGKMFFGMLALVAEFERDRIAERTADGRRGKKAKGGHIGGSAPYGHRVVGRGTGAMLTEYLPEQKTIQIICIMAANGVSCSGIARNLTDMGIMNRAGKPFAHPQIARILGRDQMGEAA